MVRFRERNDGFLPRTTRFCVRTTRYCVRTLRCREPSARACENDSEYEECIEHSRFPTFGVSVAADRFEHLAATYLSRRRGRDGIIARHGRPTSISRVRLTGRAAAL